MNYEMFRFHILYPGPISFISLYSFSAVEGYDTYDWPEGFNPGNVPVCDVVPPDGRGVPEQVCAFSSLHFISLALHVPNSHVSLLSFGTALKSRSELQTSAPLVPRLLLLRLR